MSTFDYTPEQQTITKAKVKRFVYEAVPIPNADIVYELGYMDGDTFVRIKDQYLHVQDYPEVLAEDGVTVITPAITDFTDLINNINSGSSISTSVKNFLKYKLGII